MAFKNQHYVANFEYVYGLLEFKDSLSHFLIMYEQSVLQYMHKYKSKTMNIAQIMKLIEKKNVKPPSRTNS